MAAGGDNVWQRLAKIIGGETLAEDIRYKTSRDRIKRSDELEQLIGNWIAERNFEEVEQTLIEAGVPAGGILRASDIAEDPHYRERASLIEFEDPVNGKIAMPGIIPKLSQTPGEVKWMGPTLGAHNEEIYEDLLNKTKKELEALQKEGII